MITSDKIDKQVLPVLREIEENGVLLDVNFLEDLKEEFSQKLNLLAGNIYQEVGFEFNIDSPKQLSKVLYEDLNLAALAAEASKASGVFQYGAKKTKTHLSTAAGELQKIADLHPSINLILQYREAKKLLSTYIKPLPKLVGEDGRLRTTYAIDTASGRLSSKNPNLQNIPIKNADGKRIRQAFIAPSGKKLLAVDYSQMQLRIAAHFSGDETLVNAFQKGEDIHQATADKMNVPRYVAKTINFGVLFGQSAFALAGDLGISQKEAQEFIDQYFISFPKLASWIESVKNQAYETGQVETMFGRPRDLVEDLQARGYRAGFAERVAVNHPIQGTEADIMKIAMIELSKKIPTGATMILQVHDELVFEVDEQVAEQVAEEIIKIMESVVPLSVPLKTDYAIGDNWAELK